MPFYVGQAKKLRSRLLDHANNPSTSYYNFWNYFSVFVPDDEKSRSDIEALLIAAMPTENRAMPKLHKVPFPRILAKMVRDSQNPKGPEDTANERRAAAKSAVLTRKRRVAGRKAAATRSAKAV